LRAGLIAIASLSTGSANGSPGALPDGLVDIAALAPDVVVDARYAGSDNFMGRPAREPFPDTTFDFEIRPAR
jgi:D-alanyl-D-alanine dipeptidase